jgi:hypothetical protein
MEENLTEKQIKKRIDFIVHRIAKCEKERVIEFYEDMLDRLSILLKQIYDKPKI